MGSKKTALAPATNQEGKKEKMSALLETSQEGKLAERWKKAKCEQNWMAGESKREKLRTRGQRNSHKGPGVFL